MVDLQLTGITLNNDYNVYTGNTPTSKTMYAEYPSSATTITITGVPFNYKIFVIIEDTVTKWKTIKQIRTPSAKCEPGFCGASFVLSQVPAPTPTISLTPTFTPTISITPTKTPTPTPTSSEKIAFSPTPTPTKSATPTPTPTLTPTITPSTSTSMGCGNYILRYNDDSGIRLSLNLVYIDCSGIERDASLQNGEESYACIQEVDGNPIISVVSNFVQGYSITRNGNC